MKLRSFLVICLFTMLVISGCQPESSQLPSSDQQEPAATGAAIDVQSVRTVIPEVGATPAPTGTATVIALADDQTSGGEESGEQPEAVQAARADLARRSGRAPAEIEVVSVSEMEWSDAALGCPLPDITYAQQVTPGYLVMMTLEGEQYEYHTDTGQRTILCGEDGSPILPELPANPKDIDDDRPWLPVD